MKTSILALFCLLLTACHRNASDSTSENITAEKIVQSIEEPSIPAYEINLLDFGGSNDSVTDNKKAFANAIAHLTQKGGGKLVIPPGTYLVNGPIHLKSDVELHVSEGAKIYFGSNPSDYLPAVRTSWEGTFIYNYSPFIYAINGENIVISGKGIIDGEASKTWSTWKEKQKPDQLLSREMNHKQVPIEDREFGEGHYLRPQLIQFFDCKKIKVEGIRMEDSPFWCLHLLRCENVVVRGVSYAAFNKNNDGIDPEYSRNVLIEKVTFNNSDDNVAIKAGRDDDGRASTIISENIVVRNCSFKGLHAIVIGSEMSAGVQNVFVEDCDYAGDLKRGVFLKSNPDRGGFIKNIHINNVDFGNVEDCIYITSFYHNEGEGHATEIRDIHFNNITCQEATGTGIVIQGFPEKKVKDVYFNKVTIKAANNAISMSATENIVFSDLTIGKLATPPSFVK